MSIVLVDGFGTYGNQTGAEQAGWSFSKPAAIVAGRFAGTSALKLTTLFANARRPLTNVASGASEFVIGFAYRPDASSSDGYQIASFISAVIPEYQLVVTGAGFLRLRSNSNRATINPVYQTLADGTANLSAVGAWNYIELRVYDGTSFQVFVNGILDMSGNIADIFNIRAVNFGYDNIMDSGGNTPNFRITDLYFKVAGGTYNADTLPLGDCRVVTKLPEVDVTVGFVPSSGTTNVENVDDIPNDGDATFVSAANTGTFDAYRSTTPLPFNPQTVHAVAISLTARKTDAGLRKVGIRVQAAGGTVVNYPGLPLGISYQRIQEIIERDPDGNVVWTKPKIDSLLFGPIVEV